MRVEDTELPGVLLVTPDVHRDNRGYFLETHRTSLLSNAAGQEIRFVQGSTSSSLPWVLRGMHFQIEQPQGKLVRVLTGEIYDVAVDLRVGSPHFKRWIARRLSAAGPALYIPPGFAHGFLTTSSSGAVIAYECTTEYVETWARSVRWDDPELGIAWPLAIPTDMRQIITPVLSARDRSAPSLRTLDAAYSLPSYGASKAAA